MFRRALEIYLPPQQSAFLWGPRKAGKSTYLHERFPNSLYLDLLDSDVRIPLLRRPQLRELIDGATAEQRKLPIIIDEVQKVPDLLDEIHWLIENRGLSFILCGSSARKLKRGQANLLGGRAWRFELFPLVTAEVPDLDLLRALQWGLIPSHYLSANPERSLQSFVNDYLQEEIAAEAATRNLAAFARFLDLAGITNGELVNHKQIASDVGVDAKSVKSYFQILTDTLLGRYLEPLPVKPGSRKNLVATPKFYLFDPGVVSILRHTQLTGLNGAEAGHLFETFIANELFAWMSYRERRRPIHFYRTRTGAEIDFVLGKGEAAIEVKLTDRIRATDLQSLNGFLAEYPTARAIVVCLEKLPRVVEAEGRAITILPWRDFCQRLWSGALLDSATSSTASS
jgi:predicted AAA+ superfamily ATPase